MRGLVRKLLAMVGLLGLVAVAAVVYITSFFDPNDLKPRLIETVHQQSGLELALDGPLSWSFYPRLGVSVEDAQAWLPAQSHDEAAFAAIDRAEVSLAFTPLLSGEIAIDGLILDGMRLDLVRDGQGRGNWEALLERLDKKGADAEAALAPASAGPAMREGSPSVALDIANVQVRNSQVAYADRRSDLDVTLRDLEITGTHVNPEQAFPVKASFVLDSVVPALTSKVSLQSRVRLGLESDRYVMEGVRLDARTRLAEFDDREQTLSFKARQAIAALQDGHYQLDEAALVASLAHPSLGETPLPLELTFAGEADIQQQTAQIRDLRLTSDNGLKLTGMFSFAELLTAPGYTGQINLAPLSLRPWLKRFGITPVTANDDALTEVALTSPVKGDLSQINLASLTMLIDESTLTGRLGAGLDKRSLTFDLQGDRLDLDAYLPPADKQAGAAGNAAIKLMGQTPAHAQSEMSELMPADVLRELAMEGQLSFAELKVKGMTLLQPKMTLRGSKGQHRLERFDAQFYDGTLSAKASLDVRETPIRWAFAPRLENVQIVPLAEDYSGEPSPLRGRLNLNGDFTTRSNTPDLMLRNFNGQVAFRVADGAVFDVNVSQELCTAVAVLEGETISREWSPDTRFDRLDGSARIVDGVVRNNDLHIALPGIELTGEGRLNLPTERFDYKAQARFVDTADAACNVNPRLERVPLPVHCEGSLSDAPKQWCRFDRQAFQQALTKLARDEVKGKAVERISKQIENRLGEDGAEELRDTLRGLFR